LSEWRVEVAEQVELQSRIGKLDGADTPSPSRFLVFLRIGEISAQNPERVRVRGKIVLTKDLSGDFRG
jgi:hypothetical protein